VFVETCAKDVLHVIIFDCTVIRGHAKKKNYTSECKTFIVLDHFVVIDQLITPLSSKNGKYTLTLEFMKF